ncbi:uncharacterized protein LOC119355813 [Triticum dicoccoides]|uniref:uncharacterized protein LOC119355813 n=1 Tax=Triticum dicoccoides TaxID=85692 RepID=UPI0018904119|nr:uncharacterized protein LOC119355813 [Triticum dicoccoides]
MAEVMEVGGGVWSVDGTGCCGDLAPLISHIAAATHPDPIPPLVSLPNLVAGGLSPSSPHPSHLVPISLPHDVDRLGAKPKSPKPNPLRLPSSSILWPLPPLIPLATGFLAGDLAALLPHRCRPYPLALSHLLPLPLVVTRLGAKSATYHHRLVVNCSRSPSSPPSCFLRARASLFSADLRRSPSPTARGTGRCTRSAWKPAARMPLTTRSSTSFTTGMASSTLRSPLAPGPIPSGFCANWLL